MSVKKWLVALLLAGVVAGFFLFDLDHYLTFEQLQAQQQNLQQWRFQQPWLSTFLFFCVYVLVTAVSLPGAAIMTLAFGAVFGLLWGTVLVSFASTLGATLAFLIARFLFRDAVQQRFGGQLKVINDGIKREGGFYLFGLRLVPIFPFFVINLLMALTPIRTWTFAWVSQIGMLAGTVVYVNAGTELAQLESASGLLSPGLLLSFVLLALFPLIAKKVLARVKAYRVMADFPTPKQFDKNLVVIGAGSGGLVAAYIASAVKAKVTLIEKHRMGGDCLNTGCVPSKALIRSARFLADIARANELGFRSAQAEFDFAEIMQRVEQTIQRVAPHDSVERYTKLGVEVIEGEARVVSPYLVEVNGSEITTRNIIIASGAGPQIPPIPGLDEIDYLTSDNLWQLSDLPKRLLVLGAGPIGCELTQCFARFGSKVTMVLRGERLMRREDEEVSELVMERFRAEGVEICTRHNLVEFRTGEGGQQLLAEHDGVERSIEFDRVLIAMGRRANVTGFGLEELKVELTPQGRLAVDPFLQTNYPNIYACGDVVGPHLFTHTASHQAWYATVNALFGGLRRFKVDYSVIPYATFTDPEVARVGLNELQAKEQGVDYEVTRFGLEELDRAIADGRAEGFVKVLTVPGGDKILGATILGDHAGELITEFVTAMRHNLGMKKILGTIHIYPTWSEANKYTAGNWRRAHVSLRWFLWLQRFHAWRRGE